MGALRRAGLWTNLNPTKWRGFTPAKPRKVAHFCSGDWCSFSPALTVFAPASLFGQIEEGKFYRVELAAPLSGAYEARVKVVDRVLDSASGTFGIRLEIPNPDGSIPAGARCVVDFEAG